MRQKYGFLLAVDEAHATLVCGERGAGAAEALGVSHHVDLHIGACLHASLHGRSHASLHDGLHDGLHAMHMCVCMPVGVGDDFMCWRCL